MTEKPITHVLMITDMSGSMGRLADDVRGGFNDYVDELRDDDQDYRLTVTLFDDRFESLCVAAPLANVPALTARNYYPRGFTALLDAIGKTVLEFEAATTLSDDDRVLVVVQTDGRDNVSKEFTRAAIAELISTREATGKWSFVYLGAGQEAWGQADHMGFRAETVVMTTNTADSTRTSYAGLSGTTRSFSRGASGEESVADLRAALGDDSGSTGGGALVD